MSLKNKTLFITGGTRGIGLEIALQAARDGANVVIAAKTVDPNPKLEGTIASSCAAIEAAGGKALGIQTDIRDEAQIAAAVAQAVAHFGGIDILVNNASAINLTPTLTTPMKKFDLMFGVNVRGTFATSQACIPALLKSSNPHILNLAPPLNLNPQWFKNHCAYTMAKYGMSMCVLGMSEEYKGKIAVNALWPATAIWTAAMNNIPGVERAHCREPRMMAEAAHHILCQDKTITGQFYIDEQVLASRGVSNFDAYACVPGTKPFPDFFLD